MSAICDFSGLDVAGCAHCRGASAVQTGIRASSPRPSRPGWFEARYPGQCAACGEPFTAGALIRRDEDTDRWVSECCDEDEGWAET